MRSASFRSVLWMMGLLLVVLMPRVARALPPSCDALEPDKRAHALAILQSEHPYDCCDATIMQCLEKKPACRLARRLADQTCRMTAAGKDGAAIARALAQRATTMTSARPVPIDLSRAERAGEADAPVTLVAYVCARCPYCARLVPRLHQAVTEGELKRKVKAFFREFPIRSHPLSTEGAMAMAAARRLGKGWPFLLHMYRVFDTFDPAKLPDYATQYGMDRDRFIALLNDAGVRSELVESKKEGVRNRVSSTPTLFVNGRLYSTELDAETVIDVLQEEYDRATGRVRE